MKINGTKNGKLGMAMSEYLIVLAVVALGSILIFGLFGKQIKYTAARAIATLSGVTTDAKDANDEAGKAAVSTTGMQNFKDGGK